MKTSFQSTNFKADQKLLDFINERLSRLERYYDHVIETKVFLKVNKADDRNNKLVEIKMQVLNQVLFAEAIDRTFEIAADQAIEAIRVQLVRYKEKHSTAG